MSTVNKLKTLTEIRGLGLVSCFNKTLFNLEDKMQELTLFFSLGATSLALGGIFNISSTKDQLRELQKRIPVSALVSMSKSFKRYHRTEHKEVGMNYLAYDSMEEFVND